MIRIAGMFFLQKKGEHSTYETRRGKYSWLYAKLKFKRTCRRAYLRRGAKLPEDPDFRAAGGCDATINSPSVVGLGEMVTHSPSKEKKLRHA